MKKTLSFTLCISLLISALMFTPLVAEAAPSTDLVGAYWEFNTNGDVEGWTAFSKTLSPRTVADGMFKATANNVSEHDRRLSGPDNLNLGLEYSVLKYRAKIDGSIMNDAKLYFGTNGAPGIAEARTKTWPVSGGDVFVEYSIDLTTARDGNWKESIPGDKLKILWIDLFPAVANSTIEIDYIRLYKKGSNSVTYNANTTGTVTGMPLNDTMAAIGTGYLLSGQTPVRPGYRFDGWSLTQNGAVVSNNMVDISGNTVLYAQWTMLQGNTSFNAGGGRGTPPADIVGDDGTVVTLPAATGLSKAGYAFAGWSDGVDTYQAGDEYTLSGATVFTAQWAVDPAAPIMGYAWEFNTTGSLDGWTLSKVNNLRQEGGFLKAESKDGAKDARLESPTNLDLDFAYSILVYRVKLSAGLSENINQMYLTRYSDDNPNGNKNGVYDLGDNGYRTYTYAGQGLGQAGAGVFLEYVVDVSKTPDLWGIPSHWTPGKDNATGEIVPNDGIARLWMDILKPFAIGDGLELDYIRLYRKGDKTLNYDKNAGADAVTGMPANNSLVPLGTGYMLSGQVPLRTGYEFQGWAATPDGEPIAGNTVDITQNTNTVYAVWRSTASLTASFAPGIDGVTGTPPDDIPTFEAAVITLPENTFANGDHTFMGWFNGTAKYAAGASYTMGDSDVTFTPVWDMAAPAIVPANNSTGVDFRTLSVRITFPVDIDPATLTTSNISPAFAQSVSYDASTKTATVYLDPLTYNQTVSFTPSGNILSADHAYALTPQSYTFTTMTAPPDDGENIVANGDFELPFIPVYNVTAELVDDTPSGTGKALKSTTSGSYTQPKFNVFFKPDTVYLVEYDAKVSTNAAGAEVLNGTIALGVRIPSEDKDVGFFGNKSISAADGWKHFSHYTNESTYFGRNQTGATYIFPYTDPYQGSSVSFLLDNFSIKEAYPITYAKGTPGVDVEGSIDGTFRAKGGEVTLPAEGFTADGYTLTGWTDGVDTYGLGDSYTVATPGAKTLTAVWQQDEWGTLGIMGAQILADTDASSDFTTLRLLVGVNALDCTEVGFIVSAVDTVTDLDSAALSEEAVVLFTNTVYKAVVTDVGTLDPADFHGEYILATNITDIPNTYFGVTFYVKAYAKRNDGTVDYSDEHSAFVINDMIGG